LRIAGFETHILITDRFFFMLGCNAVAVTAFWNRTKSYNPNTLILDTAWSSC